MKLRKMKFTLTYNYLAIGTILVLASCGQQKHKQEAEKTAPQTIAVADASFSDERAGKVFHDYQELRKALVRSQADEVLTAAGKLGSSLPEEQVEMKSMASAMADAADIEKQRALFSDLTAAIEPLFAESLSEGSIYKQFCPMAFEGKGGYWISDVQEIRNPYYGDKMLKCGSVVETLTN